MSEPLIRLVDVVRRFRTGSTSVVALDGVGIELVSGELVALVGPSGSGKTTLINIVIGAEQPDDGRVERRDGLGVGWDDVAFVPQGLGLLGELTIGENIELPGRFGSGPTAADRVMARLGLSDLSARFPEEVSLGEQQRAAVARAVIADPIVLVADEPTAHQDEANVARIMAELRRLASQGTAVLVATHEERIVESLDRVVAMADGRIAETASGRTTASE